MISYADFMTLMFAFFVVLYALSSIDLKKWVDTSASVRSAFGEAQAIRPIAPIVALSATPGTVANSAADHDFEGSGQAAWELLVLNNQLQDVLNSHEIAGDEQSDPVRLAVSSRGVTVTLASNYFFSAGTADLDEKARALLDEIGGVIATSGNELRIEGHTDDSPVKGGRFTSNWQLSGARASSVAEYLIEKQRLSPRRIGIAGFGSTRPASKDATDEARAINRRVDIVILAPSAAALESASGIQGHTLEDLVDQLNPVESLPKPTGQPKPGKIKPPTFVPELGEII